jgi:hypothetical protein
VNGFEKWDFTVVSCGSTPGPANNSIEKCGRDATDVEALDESSEDNKQEIDHAQRENAWDIDRA